MGEGSGALYVVATPIGNLNDITLRAIKTLRSVDMIAAEDTRRTRTLLSRYRIRTRLISYHDHNEERQARSIVDAIEAGSSVALVSDAGTPGISDPGYRVLALAAERGQRIIPVPGVSALTAALSVAALPVDRFTFAGFLSRRAGRRAAQLEELALSGGAVVLFESPRRLKATLGQIMSAFGPDRRAVVVREATKAFEEVSRGTLRELMDGVEDVTRGEITLVIEGAVDGGGEGAGYPVHEEVALLESWGIRRPEAIRRVARGHGLPGSAVYRAVVEAQGEQH